MRNITNLIDMLKKFSYQKIAAAELGHFSMDVALQLIDANADGMVEVLIQNNDAKALSQLELARADILEGVKQIYGVSPASTSFYEKNISMIDEVRNKMAGITSFRHRKTQKQINEITNQ